MNNLVKQLNFYYFVSVYSFELKTVILEREYPFIKINDLYLWYYSV